MKMWIKNRLTERTTLDGAVLVGVGVVILIAGPFRSEERRVGKECRSRWSPYH